MHKSFKEIKVQNKNEKQTNLWIPPSQFGKLLPGCLADTGQPH